MEQDTNLYTDTRGLCGRDFSFCEAVVEGLAPGGGLFVPREIPSMGLGDICALAKLPYASRASAVYSLFRPDLPQEKIDALMGRAYSSNFDDEDICPIREVEPRTHVMELWHGPTSAFKDMALQCLPLFFNAANQALSDRGDTPDHLILVATSGDTGKAALEGFRDLDHTGIIVFYPHGGVSDIQRAQMARQRGQNVGVFAAEGCFDDCQTSVKLAFNDPDFNEMLKSKYGVSLSSANSINWGRLLPQVVYYISAYGKMVQSGAVKAGEGIDVCVPTGNFGNILAAWYAREIGTPILRLLCASNENRVLTDFLETGVYDISSREFLLTPSPSMDILVSSNLERQLFELTGRNAGAIRAWMEDLREKKRFEADSVTFAKIREVYAGGSANAQECFETIRETYRDRRYLLDPHTAVAYRVAKTLKRPDVPLLVASTAHWAKFGADVYRALEGIEPGGELPEGIRSMGGLEIDFHIQKNYVGAGEVPKGLAELAGLPDRFTQVTSGTKEGVEECVLSFLERRKA